LLRLAPADFVDKFLLKDVRPKALVEGEDFHFGAQRAGTLDTLKEMASSDGFNVVVVPAKLVKLSTGQSVRVSSTTIRYMLQSGHVADASVLLGRPYRIIGQIISGKGRGRQIGYPTLNLKMPSQIIPQDGVYAGCVLLGRAEDDVCRQSKRLNAVFSIGQAVTFGDRHEPLIEAHVLDNKPDDKAGPWMAMDFVKRIRPQQRFESPEALAVQIADDCRVARNILAAQAIDTKEK
jgi:riboflavin kinase/FMN adenylyltransferase